MLYSKDNRFAESASPHSLGLRNGMTIPSPGFDQNPLMLNEKRYWGATSQGFGGLSFDGTGLLGTGLFAGDMTTWNMEWVVLIGLGYLIYTKLEGRWNSRSGITVTPHKRRRKVVVAGDGV